MPKKVPLSLPLAMQQAIAAYLRGDRLEAERLCRLILDEKANHVSALNLLGSIAVQTDRAQEAVQLLGRAIAADPSNALAHSNRGNALKELKQLDDALASYDQAIMLKPDFADAYYNRGIALQELRRLDEALASYDQALKYKPDDAEAYFYRGNTLKQLKRPEEALTSYERAIWLKTDYAGAYYNRGVTLQELKRHSEALASFDRALKLKPDDAVAHYNRGVVLQELKRLDEALTSYGQALKLKRDYAEACTNRGVVLQELNRLDEALASYEEVLKLRPGDAEAYYNHGFALQELKRLDEALASYGRAIELKPDYAEAHWGLAFCRLLVGDFARGWDEFEWRWDTKFAKNSKRDFPQPLWLGKESLEGKTILLHSEQGLGDTIQFSRYVPLVAAKGATVALEVPKALVPLMAGLRGADCVLAAGNPLPKTDFHSPLLSLPLAFGTSVQSIPGSIPYLSTDQKGISARRNQLKGNGETLVGVCWKGDPAYIGDRKRSVGLADFAPLLSVSGVRFVSLHKELAEDERAVTAGLPNFIHPGEDFAGTAEIVAALDLVITVDTAWAHWSGAIGKPVWILLAFVPHWCWLMNREDSPWYPTAKLFRQSAFGDWAGVVNNVREELAQRFSVKGQSR